MIITKDDIKKENSSKISYKIIKPMSIKAHFELKVYLKTTAKSVEYRPKVSGKKNKPLWCKKLIHEKDRDTGRDTSRTMYFNYETDEYVEKVVYRDDGSIKFEKTQKLSKKQ